MVPQLETAQATAIPPSHRETCRLGPLSGPSRLHASRTPAFFTSNMPLTESPVWMQVITCASNLPTDSWRTLRVVLSTLGGIGSVLATTTCSGGVACRGCREGAAGGPRRRRAGAERACVGCRACAERA